jgi:phage I-like protein
MIEALIETHLVGKKAQDFPSLNEVETSFLFNVRSKYLRAKESSTPLELSEKQKAWAHQLLEQIDDPVLDAKVRLKHVKEQVAAIKRANTIRTKDIQQTLAIIASDKRVLRGLEKKKKEYQKIVKQWGDK